MTYWKTSPTCAGLIMIFYGKMPWWISHSQDLINSTSGSMEKVVYHFLLWWRHDTYFMAFNGNRRDIGFACKICILMYTEYILNSALDNLPWTSSVSDPHTTDIGMGVPGLESGSPCGVAGRGWQWVLWLCIVFGVVYIAHYYVPSASHLSVTVQCKYWFMVPLSDSICLQSTLL